MYKLNSVIKCENLCKKFKNEEVVTDLNINIYEGDIYGFLGPNGSGKSTTIKMILGLVKPTQGKISIYGYDVNENRNKAIENIGAMVEGPSFYPYLSGYKNLMLFANLYGLKSERVLEVLEMVGLSTSKDKKVSNYSLGMKQRLAIARAFLNNPKIIILDEPTNGLDPQGVIEIRNLIKFLKEEKGVTFILCSHILSEVQSLCNRVSILNKGKLIVEDKVDKLLSDTEESLIIYTDQVKKVNELLTTIKGIEEVSSHPEGVLVKCSIGGYSKINKQLVLENISFREIKKQEISLEDFFLKKIGEEKKYV